MKLEFFKKQKNFKKGGFHTNPDVCWEIVLYVACGVVVAILFFSFFLFKQIDEGFTAAEVESNIQMKSANQERIDKVLNFFFLREEKSKEILSSPAPFVDPSL
ncbi:MAG: hypothetical protein KBC06_01895 [Candidatus Pacebacteria bacterium]|nr:hypothetical protein [Candidatus Paceibacterota bacterium]